MYSGKKTARLSAHKKIITYGIAAKSGKMLPVLVLLLILVSHAGTASAQTPPALPEDPRMFHGTLPNGLAYYVTKFKHPLPEDTLVNFYLIQKTGFLAEKEDETGFSEIIADLALKGTRNFPDNSMKVFLETQGAISDASGAEVMPDHTLFKIKGIPASSESLIDTALLVLYDWSCFINIDDQDMESSIAGPEDIAKIAIRDKIIDENEYIGLIDSVSAAGITDTAYPRQIRSKALRNFYYKWYRPDMQAIIITGNVDSASIESKIKSLFSSIPKSRYSKIPLYVENIGEDRTETFIIRDNGIRRASLCMTFIDREMDMELMNTSASYIDESLRTITGTSLAYRIMEMAALADIPLRNAEFSTKNLPSENMASILSIEAEIHPAHVAETASLFAEETERIRKFGLTKEEIKMGKAAYMEKLKREYSDRKKPEGIDFFKMFSDNFLYGKNLSSIELKYTMTGEILAEIPDSAVNAYAKSLFDTGCCDIILKLPGETGAGITAQEIEESFKEGAGRASVSYLDKPIFPLFTNPPAPSKQDKAIVHDSTDTANGAKIWRLSNNATVVFLKNRLSDSTAFFSAFKPGGKSDWKGNSAGYRVLCCGISDMGGLSNLNSLDLERYMESKGLCIRTCITPDSYEIRGYFPVSSLDEFMKLLNMNFTDRRIDEDAFSRFVKFLEAEAMQSSADSVAATMPAAGHPYLTEEEIRTLDYTEISEFIEKGFGNASGFTFIFTGNINESALRQSAAKYIASIPAGNDLSGTGSQNRISGSNGVPCKIVPAIPEKACGIAETDMPINEITEYIIAEMEPTRENRMLAEMTVLFIEDLLERSEMSFDIIRNPENMFLFTIKFHAGKNGITAVEELIKERAASLGKDDDGIFNAISKYLRHRYDRILRKNSHMADMLHEKYMHGEYSQAGPYETLESISPEMLRDFILEILDSGNKTAIAG